MTPEIVIQDYRRKAMERRRIERLYEHLVNIIWVERRIDIRKNGALRHILLRADGLHMLWKTQRMADTIAYYAEAAAHAVQLEVPKRYGMCSFMRCGYPIREVDGFKKPKTPAGSKSVPAAAAG